MRNWINTIRSDFKATKFLSVWVNSTFGSPVATTCSQDHADSASDQFANAADTSHFPIAFYPDDAQAYFRRGFAAKEDGRFDEAERCFKRTLSIDPLIADAHYMLGLLAQHGGSDSNACLHFRTALELAPDNESALRDFCHYLSQRGRVDEAVQIARQGIAQNPTSAIMHFCLGNINGSLQERSRLEDAVTNYRRALKINPDFAEAHYNLGNALLALARSEEAAASYRRALTINPDFAEAHYNLGNALLELSQIEDAVTSYLRALNINHFLIEAQINLGVVLARHGRSANTAFLNGVKFNPKVSETLVALAELRSSEGNFSEATELFRCALSIDPESAHACAGLARTRKMTSRDHAWLARAQTLVASKLPPQKEASLHYAIGKYHDDVGSFAQAFDHYRTANEMIKQCGPKYERQHQTQVVDMLIRACDRGWIERHRMTIQSSARPVFIVGMPRSGTSLAEQILASHPAIFGAGELYYFWRCAAEVLNSSIAYGVDCVADLRKIGCDYLAHLESLSADTLRTIDKFTGNFLFLGLIHAAFPKARIIHMQRNPLDTCLSLYFQNFGTDMPYRNDLEDLAHFYGSYVRIMDHWNAVLPQDAILHVPYEGLIDDQQGWSRKMLEFVGMPWDERCIDFHRNVRPVVTASNWQVRQPIYKSSVERWRNYAPFIAPLLNLLELSPS